MAAGQEKLKKLFQRERDRERLQGRRQGADSGAVGAARQEKLKKIFRHFDTDGDGRLDRAEMAALIRAVNPRISFTGQQTDAIVDAVFRTYCDLLGRDDQHVTVDGLLRTCGDGTADLDRDFDTLGLSLDDDSRAPPDATATSTASCVSPTFLSQPPPSPPSERLVAGEVDGQNGRLGQQRMNGEGAVSPGADGDGASTRQSVAGEPPSSLASVAGDSELDCRNRIPPSSELEEDGDGASRRPSVAWDRWPSLASSSFCSETEDSEIDYWDFLPQSEIEERPSLRWLSPSLLPRPPATHQPESSESPSPLPRPPVTQQPESSESPSLLPRQPHSHRTESSEEIEERPIRRWLSPSLFSRPPPPQRPESSEVNWEQLVSPSLLSYSTGSLDDGTPEDVKWTVLGRDESSGKIYCLVLARGMNFRWQDKRGGCWRYDCAVAVLSEVCWLEIGAEVAAADLSAETAYVCVLVFKLSPGAFGLGVSGETQEASVCLGHGCVSHSTVRLQPLRNRKIQEAHDRAGKPRQRKDGWMEIVLGEFSVGNVDRDVDRVVVGVELTEVKRRTQLKGGLVVRGLELRPKGFAYKVLTNVEKPTTGSFDSEISHAIPAIREVNMW